MAGRRLLPSTPLDWAAARHEHGPWRPPAELGRRARYLMLVVTLLLLGAQVPAILGRAREAPWASAAAAAAALILAASWIDAYRRARHPGAALVLEAPALAALCIGVGAPQRALSVVFAATVYTALFASIRVARGSGLSYIGAFLVAAALGTAPHVPAFWSAETLAPAALVPVVGGLVFSMARLMDRSERERARLEVVAALGESLVAAEDHGRILDAGLDAAMTLTAQEGATGAGILEAHAGGWTLVRGRGALAPVAEGRPSMEEVAGESARGVTELTGAAAAAVAAALGHDGPAEQILLIRGDTVGAEGPRLALVVGSRELLAEETRSQLGVVVRQAALAAALGRSRGALVRAERLAAIGQLAATVGHELRNPLAAIRSAGAFLRRRVGRGSADARVPQFFDIIEREVDASNRIITELLDFARSRPLLCAPTDLRALVEEVREIVPHGERRLTNAIPVELPAQILDGAQIRQVLVNLVQNAVDALAEGPGGEVVVRAAVEGGALVIVVEDDGPGMPPDVAARAFEPLFTTKSKGTGLGLALVQKVVTAHRGAVRVTSREPRGTRVVAEIPPQV